MIRTILFDFGNVIAHFDHRRATRKFAPETDLSEVEVFDAIYNTALEEEFECGNLNGDEFIHAACAVIGYRNSHAQFRRDFVDIFTANPEVCALIPKLGDYRLVLASNTNELHAEHFEEKFSKTLGHFAAMGYSFRAGSRKPHPGFYNFCQTLAEAEPPECLFIDDVVTHCEAAQAFGWKAIHFTNYDDLLKQLSDFEIRS
jgi:putative hydrolase of the HAD superfamily